MRSANHHPQVEGGDIVGMKGYFNSGNAMGDSSVKLSAPKIFRDGKKNNVFAGTLDLNSASPITVQGIRWGKDTDSNKAECGNI